MSVAAPTQFKLARYDIAVPGKGNRKEHFTMKKYVSLMLAALLILGAAAGCGAQENTPAPVASGPSLPAQAAPPADPCRFLDWSTR